MQGIDTPVFRFQFNVEGAMNMASSLGQRSCQWLTAVGPGAAQGNMFPKEPGSLLAFDFLLCMVVLAVGKEVVHG